MDINSELDRLFPGIIEEPTDQHAARLKAFLLGLVKKDYEVVLNLLPDRLARPHDPVVRAAAAWAKFVDDVGYDAVYGYTRHIAPGDVLGLLTNISTNVYRLSQTMSEAQRDRLMLHVFTLAVDRVRGYLESHFKGDRPGMIDIAIEELLKALEKKKAPPRGGLSRSDARDERILKTIQEQRRKDARSLPVDLRTAADVRFVVEEIHREFFVYPPHAAPPNEGQAMWLIMKVYDWFGRSTLYQTTRSYPQLYGVETGFFDDLAETRDKIRIGQEIWPHWKAKILNPLRSERFWHNLSGLNEDPGVPFDSTEASKRVSAYKRWALADAAVLAVVVVLPGLAATVPGAAGAVIRWVGGRLLLASQYGHATYRTFGAVRGAAYVAKDAYLFYAANAVTINGLVQQGTEIGLEFAGQESGSAPGASAPDLAMAAAERVALTARKGISGVAESARAARSVPSGAVARAAEVEVETVELVAARAADGELYHVVAKVRGGTETKVKAVVTDFKKATDVDGTSQKTVAIYVKDPDGKKAVNEARGTTRIERPWFDEASRATEIERPKYQQLQQQKTKITQDQGGPTTASPGTKDPPPKRGPASSKTEVERGTKQTKAQEPDESDYELTGSKSKGQDKKAREKSKSQRGGSDAREAAEEAAVGKGTQRRGKDDPRKGASPRPANEVPGPRRPPPPPVTTTPVRRLPPGEARDFLKANVNSRAYSPEIRKAINALPATGSPKGLKTELERIDRMIRQHNARRANLKIGASNPDAGPFVQSQRAASNEGGLFAYSVNENELLSVSGRTRTTGQMVEFDSVTFSSKSVIETKMTISGVPEYKLYDQMRKQAQFMEDWKLNYVVWEIYEPGDVAAHAKRLVGIAEKLLAENKALGSRIRIRHPPSAHDPIPEPFNID